jgi:hypothetical protein
MPEHLSTFGEETMTELEEIIFYLTNVIQVGFGLGIGGNQKIIHIVFEGFSQEQEQQVKDDLIAQFPNVVNFF